MLGCIRTKARDLPPRNRESLVIKRIICDDKDNGMVWADMGIADLPAALKMGFPKGGNQDYSSEICSSPPS